MDWRQHPVAWLASKLTQPKQDTVGEVWASDLRSRVRSALAEGRADEAVADARSVMAVNADVAPVGEPYLTARQMLVQALMQSGRHGEAVEELTWFIDAISTNRRKSGLLLMLRVGRAGQLAYLGQVDESEAESRSVIERCGELPPGRARDHGRSTAVNNLLVVLNGRGLYAEAELAARQAMSEVEPATECEHALPLLRRCLAASLNGQGQYAEAELQLRDLRPEGAVAIVSVRTHLAAAQLGLGNLGEAEAGAREAEETGKHRLSPRHYLTLTAGTLLGTVLARQGRPDEARRQLQDNAAAWAEYFGDAHPKTIAARTELAM